MALPVSLFLEGLETWAARDRAPASISVIVAASAAAANDGFDQMLAGLSLQSAADLEIIIADDGTRGARRAALDELWRTDGRVTLLRFARAGGIPAVGINAALGRAVGRFIGYQTGRLPYAADAVAMLRDRLEADEALLAAGEAAQPVLDAVLHERRLLTAAGLADPHLSMCEDWADDLLERLVAAGYAAGGSQARSLRMPEPSIAALRRALSRADLLQADAMDSLDVLDASFLDSEALADRFSEELAAPYVARHWQQGERLHPQAVPHMALCRPLRLAIRGAIPSAGAEITYGNFARVFPDRLSIRAISKVEDIWDNAADDALVNYKFLLPPDPAAHTPYRDARKPVIYAMDDNLLALHEIPHWGEAFAEQHRADILVHLRDADYALGWSPRLADEIRPINPRVGSLHTNLPAARLPAAPTPPPSDGRLLFTTLTHLLHQRVSWWEPVVAEWADFFRRHRDEAKLALFGYREEDLAWYRERFAGIHYEVLPYQPYNDYIDTIGAGGFHVVLSQIVDHSVFIASKCPVKLLEATRCGAILLTSDVEPYRVAEDGIDCLKVSPRLGAWTVALERSLALGPTGRARMWRAARRLVAREFTTESQYFPFFLAHETARLHAVLGSSRSPETTPLILFVEPAAPEAATAFRAWAGLLARQGIATRMAAEETPPADCDLLLAEQPVALVHVASLASPWIGAAGRAGLPWVATVAAAAEIPDGAAPSPEERSALLIARSRSAAKRLRVAGWTAVHRLVRPLPDQAWASALPEGWPDPGRRRIGLICGPDAEAGATRSAVEEALDRLPAALREGTGATPGPGPWDILILAGEGGAITEAALAAMAGGTLVIALGSADLDEILQHGVNGWSLPESETAVLARLLGDILTTGPQGLARVRRRARATAWARSAEDATLLNLLGLHRTALAHRRFALRPITVDSFAAATPLSAWKLDRSRHQGKVDRLHVEAGTGEPWRNDHVLALSGWAGGTEEGLRAETVLFSLGDAIVGAAAVDQPRPDVAAAIHPNLSTSGWSARLLIGHLTRASGAVPARLEAWGVHPRGGGLLFAGTIDVNLPARDPELSLDRFVSAREMPAPPPLAVDSFAAPSAPLSAWRAERAAGNGAIDVVQIAPDDGAAWRDDKLLILTGWAGEASTGCPAGRVLLTLEGMVVGTAETGLSRPDLTAVHPGLSTAGWTARLLIGHLTRPEVGRPQALVEAWGLQPDGRLILAGGVRVSLPARDPSRPLDRFVSAPESLAKPTA